mmetsp:Transcript_14556/g.30511  ORF Transcript_14556/g.30511 Transcript_14556/m.30511 type:complete len:203 (-) Transcript_14556:268-876(-)
MDMQLSDSELPWAYHERAHQSDLVPSHLSVQRLAHGESVSSIGVQPASRHQQRYHLAAQCPHQSAGLARPPRAICLCQVRQHSACQACPRRRAPRARRVQPENLPELFQAQGVVHGAAEVQPSGLEAVVQQELVIELVGASLLREPAHGGRVLVAVHEEVRHEEVVLEGLAGHDLQNVGLAPALAATAARNAAWPAARPAGS